MNVLFDTNVILDLLLDRKPWGADAADLVGRVERGPIQGYLCATTVTTIDYLAAKRLGTRAAKSAVRQLLTLFSVAPVNQRVLESALETTIDDFEDAVLCEAARQVEVATLVTRNPRDFRKAEALTILTPPELLYRLDNPL